MLFSERSLTWDYPSRVEGPSGTPTRPPAPSGANRRYAGGRKANRDRTDTPWRRLPPKLARPARWDDAPTERQSRPVHPPRTGRAASGPAQTDEAETWAPARLREQVPAIEGSSAPAPGPGGRRTVTRSGASASRPRVREAPESIASRKDAGTSVPWPAAETTA